MKLSQQAFIFLSLILIGTLKSFAIYQAGEMYLDNGDTLKCEISVYKHNVFITPWKSEQITYRIDKNTLKIEMDSVIALRVGDCLYESQVIPIVSYVMRGGNKVKKTKMLRCFVKIAVDGYSRLWVHYYTQSSGGGTMHGMPMHSQEYLSSDYYLNIQENTEKISTTIFKKTLKNMYQDCPTLLAKVKSKEFKYEDIIEVVNFANSNCLKSSD